MDENECSNAIIGAAIEVHRHLGPGLLEAAYELALGHELGSRGLRFSRQLKLPAVYKGVELPDSYRIDLLVEDLVIVEVKAVEKLAPFTKFSCSRICASPISASVCCLISMSPYCETVSGEWSII